MLENISYKLHSMSLFKRLTIMFLIFSIIPILIMGVVSVNVASAEVEKRYINDVSFRLEQVDKQMDELFTYLDYVNITFAIDEDVNTVLKEPLENERGLLAENALDKKLYDSKYASDIETSIYLVGMNGRMYSNDYEGSVEFIPAQALEHLLQKDTRNTAIMLDEMMACGYHMVVTARRIEDTDTREVIGIVITAVNIHHITDIFDVNFVQTQSSILMIYGGRVIASSGIASLAGESEDEVFGDLLSDGSALPEKVLVQGEPYLPMTHDSGKNGLMLVALIPKAEISEATLYIVLLMALLCMGIAVCAVIASVAFSRSISKPIKKLCVSMQNAEEGRFMPGFIPLYNDEVGMLAHNFNTMMMKIDNYIKRIGEVERDKHIAEYKALVSQINPHFLYNTMSSIIWLINNNKKDEAMEMTDALSKLFRISINNDEFLTIQREMEYCKYYLAIQQLRYTSELTYSISMEEAVGHFTIIKLVVQPLIENALYHGVRKKDGGGHIAVGASLRGNCLCITVSDNGGTLTEQKCTEINAMLAGGPDMSGTGIGIKNADERLKLYYGKEYGIHYRISDGYTIVEIIIPIRTEENDV
ncbi:MAG: sensor histidine kinase [Eubacteriales bacterium]|nr:sensor histidine kinase [Eubacteriales bacterium]